MSFGAAVAADNVSLQDKDDILNQIALGMGSKQGTRLLTVDADKPYLEPIILATKLDNILANQDIKHERYQQYLSGIPIWSHQVILHKQASNIYNINGKIINNHIILDKNTTYYKDVNVDDDIDGFILSKFRWFDRNNSQELERNKYIYIDDGHAYLSLFVQKKITDTQGNIAIPSIIIDLESGKILKYWNNLQFEQATGPGGNIKVGQYQFGQDYPFLDVSHSNGQCQFNNDNVMTIDMKNGTTNTTPYQFGCGNNEYKQVNGAFSPLNDAHAFATNVVELYQQWFGIKPLDKKLIMRVHYRQNFENAMWDGSALSFGDGGNKYFPMVSLDIVGHEVSHGFTSQHSKLIYWGQSGAINESFSDMAGEAVEYFVKGENDWLVGADISKHKPAMRYFDDPTKDGISVAHIKDYQEGMDVHFGSGIFNHAFYLLAHKPQWNVRKAFSAMLYANKNYWLPNTDFNSAACGVINSAADLGYNPFDVIDAFAVVGVQCQQLPELDLDHDGMSDFWEKAHDLDINGNDAGFDPDSDGLTNIEEFNALTNPHLADSDSDGLTDKAELVQYKTSPIYADTDKDGMSDGWEVQHQLLPLDKRDANQDIDQDGFTNLVEFVLATDPRNAKQKPELIRQKTYSFEQQQLPHNWQSDSWQPSNLAAYDGNMALSVSSAVAEAQLDWQGYFAKGYVHFNFKQQSDNVCQAQLIVMVDGRPVASLKANAQWQNYHYPLTAGLHKVSWRYQTGNCGDSSFIFVDKVSYGAFDGDADGDQIPDIWELQHGLDPTLTADAQQDWDGDYLSNLQEFQQQTLLDNADSDGDLINDGFELQFGLNPLVDDANTDIDADGIDALSEYIGGSQPNNKQSTPADIDDFYDDFSQGLNTARWRHLVNHRVNWQVKKLAIQGQSLIFDGKANIDVELALSGRFKQSYLVFDYQLNSTAQASLLTRHQQLSLQPSATWCKQIIDINAGINWLKIAVKSSAKNSRLVIDNVHLVSINSTQDIDADGLPDYWELANNLDISNSADASWDADNDGLTNLREFQLGTSATIADSDADGIDDGWEVTHQLNPLDKSDATTDIDRDGFSQLQEFLANTDPNNAANKPQALVSFADSFEQSQLTSPWQMFTLSNSPWHFTQAKASAGLVSLAITGAMTNNQLAVCGMFKQGYVVFDYQLEHAQLSLHGDNSQHVLTETAQWQTQVIKVNAGANCLRWQYQGANAQAHFALDNVVIVPENSNLDHDQDGMLDAWELANQFNISDKNDALIDSDGDGLNNLAEFKAKTLPRHIDTDLDHIFDGWEVQHQLNPHNKQDAQLDNDADGYSNYMEFIAATDPNDANDIPQFASQHIWSFEDNSVPANWYKPTKADASWVISDAYATQGKYSLKADNIGPLQRAQIELQHLFKSSYILFDIKTSTESCCDKFNLYIDNKLTLQLSGIIQWRTQIVAIPRGIHKLRFEYVKDKFSDKGEDSVWIDNIRYGEQVEIDQDGDGLNDIWELSHGLSNTDASDALLDNDNDGLINAQEYQIGSNINQADSDNDGIDDGEDEVPLDPTLGSLLPPVFHLADTLYVEAQGPLTEIEFPAGGVTDNGWLPPTVSHNLASALALGQYQIVWTATDSAGNQSQAKQQLIVQDTQAPVFSSNEIKQISAQGYFTWLAGDIGLYAIDKVDGDITVKIAQPKAYRSGAQQVPLTATDASGNHANATAVVHIVPLVSIAPKLMMTHQGHLQAKVVLSGQAVTYPVTVQYQWQQDGRYQQAQLVIDQSQQGNIAIDKIDAGSQLTLLSAKHALLGEQVTAQVQAHQHGAGVLQIQVSQQQRAVNQINMQAGLVTVTAKIIGSEQDDVMPPIEFVIDEPLASAVVKRAPYQLQLDPAKLSAGDYSLTVTDTTVDYKRHYQLPLVLVTNQAQLTQADTDKDGIADIDEGYFDDDLDGISNYVDNDSAQSRLHINQGLPVSSDKAQMLRSGAWSQQIRGLIEPKNSVGVGISISQWQSLCERITATDNCLLTAATKESFKAQTPVIDLVVTETLNRGNTSIVVSLNDNLVVDVQTQLYHYQVQSGWQTLQESTRDSIASSVKDKQGNCPALDSSQYQAGLAWGVSVLGLHWQTMVMQIMMVIKMAKWR
ncbi:M4 family metallopeptidase [Shewanella marina]|uniref:M4 family metallopeptidase n=1 Tax=Shewanella marina TaxID=487319 RepID=UPI000AFD5064|nr:M4 family metallopeptidase [Shewanella marina]